MPLQKRSEKSMKHPPLKKKEKKKKRKKKTLKLHEEIPKLYKLNAKAKQHFG